MFEEDEESRLSQLSFLRIPDAEPVEPELLLLESFLRMLDEELEELELSLRMRDEEPAQTRVPVDELLR